MYNVLKSVAKNILPKNILIRYEESFRKFLAPMYRGENCKCNLCETSLKNFALLKNGDKICPICGSISRTRRLFMLLNEEFLFPNAKILDFSPSRVLYRNLKNRKDVAYFSTDYENEFLADYRYDITKINAENNKFDLITCYHILEHITEDQQAMNELFRVLKNGGIALVQTPFKEGEIYEDYSIVSPEERLKHFGQDDHVRIYSVSGLENRLKRAGFATEIRTFNSNEYFGLSDKETIIICRK
ncbi:class I SAM-dependent methyltransferase [Chryseobacterium scophthalmum]|uniref:class I SAM-dependent methyltransferase n=1 Tax=Chryseobacterium scophthalmum TaxID=59733 RepID=UPI00398B18A0